MKKKNIIISSFATIALCLSLLMGSTFALFTSESKVNIAVTSGKVSVVANIDENSVQTKQLYDAKYQDGKDNMYEGVATFGEEGLTLKKFVPGDGIKFNIVVKNESNVTVKYRTVISCEKDNGLFAGLNITIGENENYSGITLVSDWAQLAVGSENAIVPVTVELPEGAGDEYQEKTCTISYMVEAVQGNAMPTVNVTPDNISTVDFTQENVTFSFKGDFTDVTISELGENSVIDFNNANVQTFTINDDATLSGEATIEKLNSDKNASARTVDPIELIIKDATLEIEGELGVRYALGKSILTIENSTVFAGTIFVGEHTNNRKDALAEFNVINSKISCEENGLGSTISVWGRSGVSSRIYDSEIYTYSRGWHQSEDANDNAITFQGAKSIHVDIQRSNMHLYGARSIINARQYSSEDTSINFTIKESLLWTVTKSNHGEQTIPVWGVTEITDSILLFTKNVHQSTQAVFTSFVYGNPVIHGDYHVNTQCQWDAPIELADGQIVTFKNDANVSIYDDAGKVEFIKNGSAKVVVEDGAIIQNVNGID